MHTLSGEAATKIRTPIRTTQSRFHDATVARFCYNQRIRCNNYVQDVRTGMRYSVVINRMYTVPNKETQCHGERSEPSH
jgi:hypothetical protein